MTARRGNASGNVAFDGTVQKGAAAVAIRGKRLWVADRLAGEPPDPRARPARARARPAAARDHRHADRLASGLTEATRVRAAIVASGSELVRGDRNDRNGPFLAAELLRLGVDPARITVVGDEPGDLEAALREGLAYDLLVVSGGLGPTHDDRTVELLARAAGRRPRRRRASSQPQIEELSRRVAERLSRPYADFAHGVRKQATLPDGADVGRPRRHCAGASCSTSAAAAVVALPGPPRELQQLWPRVLETAPLRRCSARATLPRGACSASSASRNRRSRRPSRRPAATATASR